MDRSKILQELEDIKNILEYYNESSNLRDAFEKVSKVIRWLEKEDEI